MFNEFKSGVIFSYGVTNSGKTYTIIGNKREPGMLSRTLTEIFSLKEKIKKYNASTEQHSYFDDNEQVINLVKFQKLKKLKFHFESYEIYNEEIFDLMNDKDSLHSRPKLELKEGLNGQFFLKKLTRHTLTSI